ncbi:MAG TPA: SlyX family protein [Azospirillum sp.]|nr:SlyX family protein [Azospirillum sp.]
MDEAAEHRLIELETRLAHHERMAEELSSVLFEQSRAIDLLTAQVRRLKERVIALEQGHERSPQDDRPPPHY